MLITTNMDTVELLSLMEDRIPLAAAENLRDALIAAGYDNQDTTQVTEWSNLCRDAIAHAQDRISAEIWNGDYSANDPS